jgi:Cobalamin biosynthesis protein CobN and related Mg-chelatases
VTGVEILPLAMLDRPRIDVTLRISGLFRDIFESQIALFDLAVRRIAELDEPADDNPLAEARRRGADLARVFGGAPAAMARRRPTPRSTATGAPATSWARSISPPSPTPTAVSSRCAPQARASDRVSEADAGPSAGRP